jgi:tripartite-type tricarboxylate transporter receptor subunit TctC
MTKAGFRVKSFAMLLGMVVIVGLAGVAWSSEPAFPTKPVNLIVGYGAGGTNDIVQRFLTSKAEKFLGQPFVVTNNGGGGSSVAFGIIAKQKPDGYNIVGAASSGLVRIPQFRSVPYTLDDFVPIMTWGAPGLTPIVVKSTAPWKNIKDLVDFAKKNPGKIIYSTTGVGSPQHLSMEFIGKQAGVTWTHLPFPGSQPAVMALLGDHVNVSVVAGEAIPFIKEGRLRILANLSEKRIKSWPDVPTLKEQGYDYFNDSIFLFAAPKGTPSSIVEKLQNAFHKAMEDPGYVDVMARVEFEPVYKNSADTTKALQEAHARIGKIIRELKIPREGGQKK